jgi:hypothetical protein
MTLVNPQKRLFPRKTHPQPLPQQLYDPSAFGYLGGPEVQDGSVVMLERQVIMTPSRRGPSDFGSRGRDTAGNEQSRFASIPDVEEVS